MEASLPPSAALSDSALLCFKNCVSMHVGVQATTTYSVYGITIR